MSEYYLKGYADGFKTAQEFIRIFRKTLEDGSHGEDWLRSAINCLWAVEFSLEDAYTSQATVDAMPDHPTQMQ